MLKTHNSSFHKCILCICNNCYYEKRKWVYNSSPVSYTWSPQKCLAAEVHTQMGAGYNPCLSCDVFLFGSEEEWSSTLPQTYLSPQKCLAAEVHTQMGAGYNHCLSCDAFTFLNKKQSHSLLSLLPCGTSLCRSLTYCSFSCLQKEGFLQPFVCL